MANHSMKKIVTALVLAGMSVGVAQAATATGNASANVLTPLSINQTVAMNFGDVAADSAAATTVVLSTAGVASSPDKAYVKNNGAAATFRVNGATGSTYTLTLPASITLTSGGNTVTVDSLTNSSTGSLATGSEFFNVGGTLHLGANQTAGLYTGTYTVTVNY